MENEISIETRSGYRERVHCFEVCLSTMEEWCIDGSGMHLSGSKPDFQQMCCEIVFRELQDLAGWYGRTLVMAVPAGARASIDPFNWKSVAVLCVPATGNGKNYYAAVAEYGGTIQLC